MLRGKTTGNTVGAARLQNPARAHVQPRHRLAEAQTAGCAALARCRLGAASHSLDTRAVPVAGGGDWRTRGRSLPVGIPLALKWASRRAGADRKSTRLNSSHTVISYAVFCLKKKKKKPIQDPMCTSSPT